MTLPDPIKSFWIASLELNPTVEHTPWGMVVTDARYPRVYEANHASVLEPTPRLSVEDIRAELHPALADAGTPHEHIEFLDASDRSRALRQLMASTGEHDPHVLMVFEGTLGDAERVGEVLTPDMRVEEIERPDPGFWQEYRSVPNEYGELLADEVLDQMVARVRRVLGSSERFFAASVEGTIASIVSVLTLGDVACLDNVVTRSTFRRRGIGSATVGRAVSASLRAGAKTVFLLAEEVGAPRRLYERLGFRVSQRCYSFTRPLHDVAARQAPD